MEFGVALPNLGGMARPEDLVGLAQRVEELGFDSVWVSDHVVLPVKVESRYPYSSSGEFGIGSDEDILEPFTTLTFIAAMTKKVRLGISVLVLPYRHPVLNTKHLATLDVLSGGRTIVGVGAGWMKEEFDALDADCENRGRVTDEHIKVFKALCTEDEPAFEGEFYRLKGIKLFPKPVQKPHPPVWVGGTSRRAMRRAAILGDGWHVVRMRPQELARGSQDLLQIRSDHGLPKDGFQVSIRGVLDVTDDPLGDRRIPLTGSVSEIIEDVRAYEGAGAQHIVFGPRGRNIEEVRSTVERFASDVMPKL